MKQDSISIKTLKVIGTILLVSAALYAAFSLRTVVLWLVIGAFLAIIINPAVSRLATMMPKKKRGLALSIVLIALSALLIGLGAMLFRPLVNQMIALVTALPSIISNISKHIGESTSGLSQILDKYGLSTYLEGQKAEIAARASDFFVASLDKFLAVINNILAGFTIFVIAIYMSLNGPQYYKSFMSRVPASKKKDVHKLVSTMYRAVTGYINGNLLTSFVAGMSAGLVCTWLGVPYAAVLGLIVAITDLIPLIGAQLGALTVITTAYFVSPATAVIMLIFFILYQSFENYVLSPKVMARTVKISPILVFLFVICGAMLAGFVGALIAIPTGACIIILGDYLLSGTVWDKD